jgi:hypothetical protein
MSDEVCLNRHAVARIYVLVDGLLHVKEVRFRTHMTAVFLFKSFWRYLKKSLKSISVCSVKSQCVDFVSFCSQRTQTLGENFDIT